jgi:hypothetical protein
MDPLRIPKRSMPVQLQLQGQAPRQLALYLSDVTPERGPEPGRVERLSDLLEAGPAFLPAQDPATDAPAFIHLERLVCAWVPALLEYDALLASPGACVHSVQVVLSEGAPVRGSVRYVLPPGAARLTDFLNAPPRFLPVHTADEQVVLVHKRYVLEVNDLS